MIKYLDKPDKFGQLGMFSHSNHHLHRRRSALFFQPEKCQTAPWKPSFSQRFGDVQRGEASETAVKNVAANTSDGMV
jgi:hypothetical protein